MLPVVGSTLFARAKALLNAVFMSSSVHVSGSPAALVQVMVATPPDVGLVGTLIVSAEANGATSARIL